MGLPMKKEDRPYTYGDYRNWPDDERWELLNGAAWNMSPAPNRIHQKLVILLLGQILPYFESGPCEIYSAPFDVLLPDSPGQGEDDIATVVQPDIAVICEVSKLTDRGCVGAPDWIIEVLSPATSRKDQTVKVDLYERHGVGEYWIVDPGNRFLQIFRIGREGGYPGEPEMFLSPAKVSPARFPELAVDLERVFGGL